MFLMDMKNVEPLVTIREHVTKNFYAVQYKQGVWSQFTSTPFVTMFAIRPQQISPFSWYSLVTLRYTCLRILNDVYVHFVVFKEAVMKADGHIALLNSLRDNVTKETAAKGLSDLIKKQGTRRGVLDAGYISTAVKCIDQSFASAELSYGLAELCAIDVGLDKIFASSHSVQALLTLLEHCPDPRGKNSAAAVIARLFPRLCADDRDEERQKLVSDECKLLIKEVADGRCSTEILEALLAIAHVPRGKTDIFEYHGLTALLHLFPIENSNTQVSGSSSLLEQIT